MLKILPEQMEAFSSVTDELLASRIVDHLCEEYSDTTVQSPSGRLMVSEISAAELKAMVLIGLSRARAYGINRESSLAAFVAIMFAAAPNFDQHPALQPILSDETGDANDRVPHLLDQFTEKIWQDVKTNYDLSVWTAAVQANL